MLARIPAKTFLEWMAFWKLEPFGDQWRQNARICTVLQHINAGKGRKLNEEEFMPGHSQSQQKTPKELGDFLRAIANKPG
jgi:hypothetical protein